MGVRASIALVAALAVLAVGCGGDDDDAASAEDYRTDLEGAEKNLPPEDSQD